MHGNRVKINIFKCNKFNILSYIFCFSSFFDGSAGSLCCVVITSLSLGQEMSTRFNNHFQAPFIYSFISQKAFSKHLLYTHILARHPNECRGYGGNQYKLSLSSWACSLPPKELICLTVLSKITRN